ncbi:coiled-coil domain-containing protein 74B isoform X1 [Ictalurus punctatus]|uniref:Coiled-coil domain-containing protein 74B isoform X1 n=1 Tax=Ictalurus punctatus TaxID=7998 RepID=A0A2D0SZV3_ICTPU|nr:coiled-coil domain-containing protein 74B isoform X1 [Ictalurus punctatus]
MQPPRIRRKGSSCKAQKHWSELTTFESGREFYLEQTLEDTRLPQDTHLCTQTGISNETSDTSEGMTKSLPESTGGLITSLHPLRIHSSPSEPPRSPTLRECGVIIRQLYNANSLQSQEILRIKAILRDIMFNRKITPENYIMAKAYLADEKRAEEPEMFPKLPSRALPKGPVVCQAKMAERVILPSLTQSLSRRTRAVQRSRLWRKIP